MNSKAMRAALYARFSTEHQSADSIDDQFRVCERHAERLGVSVVARFHDEAVSGGTADRAGYQALLADARAHRFEMILAEDLKRLWREQAEQWRAIKELLDLGVHVVTVSGIDSRQPNFEIIASVIGAAAELDRKETAYRTRRGLEGRAQARKATGGRAYGYVAARDSKTGERVINADEAKVVVQIFTWYANGKSPRWIAGELNSQEVASPGSRWNRTSERLNAKRKRLWVSSAIHGDRRRGTGILNNRAYIGEVTWGRTVWKRSAADSKVRRWSHQSDAAQVVKYFDERLRIVPQELWDKVQARQAEVAKASEKIAAALHAGARTGRQPKHLLSGGILRCGCCGAGFVANGQGKYEAYACGTRINSRPGRGGADACPNSLRVPRRIAEERVIEGIKAELLKPERMRFFEREVLRVLEAKQSADRQTEAGRRSRVAALDKEIDNLTQAVAAGLLSPAVRNRLEAAEAERAQLRTLDVRGEARVASVGTLLPRLTDKYRSMVANLHEAMLRDVARARRDLSAILAPVRLTPDASRKFMIAEGRFDTAALLATAGIFGSVVAGAGFEPATFGL